MSPPRILQRPPALQYVDMYTQSAPIISALQSTPTCASTGGNCAAGSPPFTYTFKLTEIPCTPKEKRIVQAPVAGQALLSGSGLQVSPGGEVSAPHRSFIPNMLGVSKASWKVVAPEAPLLVGVIPQANISNICSNNEVTGIRSECLECMMGCPLQICTAGFCPSAPCCPPEPPPTPARLAPPPLVLQPATPLPCWRSWRCRPFAMPRCARAATSRQLPLTRCCTSGTPSGEWAVACRQLPACLLACLLACLPAAGGQQRAGRR